MPSSFAFLLFSLSLVTSKTRTAEPRCFWYHWVATRIAVNQLVIRQDLKPGKEKAENTSMQTERHKRRQLSRKMIISLPQISISAHNWKSSGYTRLRSTRTTSHINQVATHWSLNRNPVFNCHTKINRKLQITAIINSTLKRNYFLFPSLGLPINYSPVYRFINSSNLSHPFQLSNFLSLSFILHFYCVKRNATCYLVWTRQ